MHMNFISISMIMYLYRAAQVCNDNENVVAQKLNCDLSSCNPSKPDINPCYKPPFESLSDPCSNFDCLYDPCNKPTFDLCQDSCFKPNLDCKQDPCTDICLEDCQDKLEINTCVVFPDINKFVQKLFCFYESVGKKIKPCLEDCDPVVFCEINQIYGEMIDAFAVIIKNGGDYLASSVVNIIMNSSNTLIDIVKCSSSEEFRKILRIIGETDTELLAFIEKSIDLVLNDILKNISEGTKTYLNDVNEKITTSMDNLYLQIEELVLDPNNNEFPLDGIITNDGDLLNDNIEEYNQMIYQDIEFKLKFLMTTIDNKIEKNLSKTFENISQVLSCEERRMINELASAVCDIRTKIMSVKQKITCDQIKKIKNVIKSGFIKISNAIEEMCSVDISALVKVVNKIACEIMKICEGYVNYYDNEVIRGIQIN
ncbi:hypothetical protein DMUE_1183 [Dictyocoela muelleri]|nr:hypothetical protein DMUE_1183 [Dictyocoela muelleri]